MIKRALATAALAATATLAFVPAAAAQDEVDPSGPFDATASFVAPWDPGAFGEHSEKGLIISPYGNTGLQCHGFRDRIWDCTQTTSDGTVHALIPIVNDVRGMREVWAYNPFASGSAE